MVKDTGPALTQGKNTKPVPPVQPRPEPKGKGFRFAAGAVALLAGLALAGPAQASTGTCQRFHVEIDGAHTGYYDVYTSESAGVTTVTEIKYRTVLLLWKADRLTLATSDDGANFTVRDVEGGESKTKNDVLPRFDIFPNVSFSTPVSYRVSAWDSSGATHVTESVSC
jgi:hypothetical protein